MNTYSSSSENKETTIFTEVRIGESYKSKGWTVTKNDFNPLLSIKDYEGKIHIETNGIKAEAEIRISIHLFYYGTPISRHLEKLYDINPDTKIPIKIKMDSSCLYSNFKSKFENSEKLDHMDIELVVGKSFKNKELLLNKEISSIFLPLNEYPKTLDLLIDNKSCTGRIDVAAKLIIKNKMLEDYLEKLYEKNPYQKINVKLIFDEELVVYDLYNKYTKINSIEIPKDRTKTCIICGKNLETDETEYCKYCEKNIDIAKSLKNLLNHVNPKEKFFIENLYPHYPKFSILNTEINKLLQNNLLEFNPIDNSYFLKDEDVLEEFLNKYLITNKETENNKSINDNLKAEMPTKKQTLEESEENDETQSLKEIFDIVLNALREGKTEEEAFSLVKKSPLVKMLWINYGKEKKYPYNYFLYEYKKIEEQYRTNETTQREINERYIDYNLNEEFSHNYTKKRHIIVINAIKEGKTRTEAAKLAGINLRDIEYWYNTGKLGVEPFKGYYEDYNSNKITQQQKKKMRIEGETAKFKLSTYKKDRFILSIKDGNTVKEATEISKLESKQVTTWLTYGKQGIEPFNEFFNDYQKAKTNLNQSKKESQTINTNNSYKIDDAKIKKFRYTKERHIIVINAIKEGKARSEAAKLAGINLNDIEHWYIAGKQGIEPFKEYYEDYISSKQTPEERKQIRLNRDREEFELNLQRRNRFLDAIKHGRSIKDSLQISNLENAKLQKWLNYGKQDIKPFNIFLKEYKNARNQNEKAKSELIKYKEFKDLISNFLSKCRQKDEEEEILLKFSSIKQIFECKIYKKEEDRYYKQFLKKYNQLNRIVDKNKREYDNYKQEREDFLKEIRMMKTKEEALEKSNLKIGTFNKWVKKGEKRIEPYQTFLMKYNTAIYRIEIITENYYHYTGNQEVFLKEIKNEKDEEEALKISGLSLKLINEWIRLGELEHYPFNEFYESYEKVKKESKSKINKFKRNKNKRKRFIELTRIRRNIDIASKESGLKIEDVKDWLIKGKNGQKPYDEFYNEYNEAKIYTEKNIKKSDLELFILNKNKNELEIRIFGKIQNKSLDLITNIIKTYATKINISIKPIHKDEYEIEMRLKIKKERLDFTKSLIKAY